jgi:hypothetical protein
MPDPGVGEAGLFRRGLAGAVDGQIGFPYLPNGLRHGNVGRG